MAKGCTVVNFRTSADVQGEADGLMDLLYFPLRQPGDSRFQIGLRYRQHRITVHGARPGESVFQPERNLDGDSADGRCYRRYGDRRPHGIGFVPAEEDDWPSSGRRLQLGPPNLAFSQGQSSSGRESAAVSAMASATDASSGFCRYPFS